MYGPRRALIALGVVALIQCASAPRLERVVTLQPGDAVRVVYRDTASGLALTLQNDAVEPAEDLYSRRTGDPFVKVANDENLQMLLDALATNRFFELARQQTAAGDRPVLMVEINGETFTWERQEPAVARAADLQDFNRCFVDFNLVYNSTESFHTDVDLTVEDIRRQQEALQRRGSGRIKTDRK